MNGFVDFSEVYNKSGLCQALGAHKEATTTPISVVTLYRYDVLLSQLFYEPFGGLLLMYWSCSYMGPEHWGNIWVYFNGLMRHCFKSLAPMQIVMEDIAIFI